MTSHQIIQFLDKMGFEIFVDHWNEQDLYFGKKPDKIMDIDKLFGSAKYNLPHNVDALYNAARVILSQPMDIPNYILHNFLKSYTDIICIEKVLATRMRKHFGVQPPAAAAPAA